jgi:hypothetical protein
MLSCRLVWIASSCSTYRPTRSTATMTSDSLRGIKMTTEVAIFSVTATAATLCKGKAPRSGVQRAMATVLGDVNVHVNRRQRGAMHAHYALSESVSSFIA